MLQNEWTQEKDKGQTQTGAGEYFSQNNQSDLTILVLKGNLQKMRNRNS